MSTDDLLLLGGTGTTFGTPGGWGERIAARVARGAIRTVLKPVLAHKLPFSLQRSWIASIGALTPVSGARPRRVTVGGLSMDCVGDPGLHGRVIMHFHGGGFTTGSPRQCWGFAAKLARSTGAQVLLPSYPLAPGHVYPAPHDRAFSAYERLLELGIPSRLVTVSGDSAGANLALSTVLRASRESLPGPGAVLVISPWLDLNMTGNWDRHLEAEDPVISRRWLERSARALRGPDGAGPPLLDADLTGLPLLVIHSPAGDPLADDAVRLQARARARGVPVAFINPPGMWHAFQLLAGILPQADRAVRAIADELTELWDDGGPRSVEST
jgi:acetyl esterase/lipase